MNNRTKARGILIVALLISVWAAAARGQDDFQRTIAVYPTIRGPAAADPSTYGLDAQEITRRTEERLRDMQHFRLFERNKDIQQSVKDEQDFALSPRAAGNAARFGQLYNVSLIVQPLISEFSFRPTFAPVDGFPGKYRRVDAGRLVVAFKVLDTTTGELRHQVTAESGFSSRPVVQNEKTGGPSAQSWITMVDEVSQRGADGIVDAVWPLMVVTYKENQLFLNRGQGGGLNVGDVWTVFSVGEELRDPSTHRVLGNSELEIGKIRITRVNEKFSVAEPVGELKRPPKAGDIVRKN